MRRAEESRATNYEGGRRLRLFSSAKRPLQNTLRPAAPNIPFEQKDRCEVVEEVARSVRIFVQRTRAISDGDLSQTWQEADC